LETPSTPASDLTPTIWFHGTDGRLVRQVLKQGLENPCLTPHYELAVVYSENFGDDGVVLELHFPNTYEQFLEADRASLEEPTSWDERSSEDIQAEIEDYPKSWESLNWKDSLYLVGAVQFHGVVGPELIKAIDGDRKVDPIFPQELGI
jgi:hypothetical protein